MAFSEPGNCHTNKTHTQKKIMTCKLQLLTYSMSRGGENTFDILALMKLNNNNNKNPKKL